MKKHLLLITIYLTHSVLLISDFLEKFNQTDHKMKVERSQVVSANRDYYEILEVRTFKYNRSQAVTNITFKFLQDVEDVTIVNQNYKLSRDNDYRIFPMRFQYTFCEMLEADVYLIGTAFKQTNPGCPLKKNFTYHIGNYIFDEKRSPPQIPNGEYKIELAAFYMDKNISTTEVFYTIYRPILPTD